LPSCSIARRSNCMSPMIIHSCFDGKPPHDPLKNYDVSVFRIETVAKQSRCNRREAPSQSARRPRGCLAAPWACPAAAMPPACISKTISGTTKQRQRASFPSSPGHVPQQPSMCMIGSWGLHRKGRRHAVLPRGGDHDTDAALPLPPYFHFLVYAKP